MFAAGEQLYQPFSANGSFQARIVCATTTGNGGAKAIDLVQGRADSELTSSDWKAKHEGLQV
jgi:hypothetical protein